MRAENISARNRSKSPAPATTALRPQSTKIVAIPYYSQLVRSNGGLEHIYFKLSVDTVTGASSRPKLCVWNPREFPSLPDWMAREGIVALLCSDDRPGFEGMFAAAGITLYWNQRGDVGEMVIRWLQNQPTDTPWTSPRIAFA